MIYEYIIWFALYSIAGWMYETILCSIKERKLVNRGFLTGPYCPVYGLGAVLLIFFLSSVSHPILLFFLGVIITCTLEYFTGWLLETLFHAKWWDYSDKRFNIKGRVFLLGAVVFGLMGVLLLIFLHPFFIAQTAKLSAPAAELIALIIAVVFLLDISYSVLYVQKFNQRLRAVHLRIMDRAQNTRTYAVNKVGELVKMPLNKSFDKLMDASYIKFSGFEKRLLEASTKFTLINYNDIINGFREKLRIFISKDSLKKHMPVFIPLAILCIFGSIVILVVF